MVNAIKYRSMAAKHHRFAGMCRSRNRAKNTSTWKNNCRHSQIWRSQTSEECLDGADVPQYAENLQLIR